MERSTALLQAKALSIDDRIWLVQALWDSISAEPEQLQLTEAQQQELSVATRTARRVGKCYIM
ncbi:MAG: addiction module protein [Hormoscilla sp. GM7CHS1pb]|nr:addiction module protein [Hormoscilla sp. GM7CHS1pb]